MNRREFIINSLIAAAAAGTGIANAAENAGSSAKKPGNSEKTQPDSKKDRL